LNVTIDIKGGTLSAIGTEPRTQYGAICWRPSKDGLQVLLVTSRETGRWVVPKGWPIKGMTPEQSAAREAWEEAGVRGPVQSQCLGIYSYDKLIGPTRSALPCVVALYGIKVAELAKRFPERLQRRRKWFSSTKAATKVDEPELQILLAGLVRAGNGALAFRPGSDDAPLPDADPQGS
jgi:8-oxo-dGTP pyrophosphatase MutT (NUDIX family)